MNLAHLPGMLFSPGAGWADLMRARPSQARLLATVFAPLALIPPVMILVAADDLGAHLFPEVGASTWRLIAITFFVAECVTLALMTWVILAAARTHHGVARQYDAFVVAVVAPVPMWLSALALPTAHVPLIIGCMLAGLAASAFLIRHGVRAMLGVREVTEAGSVALIVTCAGVLAWGAMIAVVLVPAMMQS